MPAKRQAPVPEPQYIVVRDGWEYPGDDAIVQRLLAGEQIPIEARGIVAGPELGTILTADDLPAAILESGLANDIIELYVAPAEGAQDGGAE